MPLTIPQVAPNVDGLTQRTGFNAAITQIYQNMVDQAATAFTTSGTAPGFVLTPTPALAAYADGQEFEVKFHADGSSPTINVSTLGVKNLKQVDATGAKVPATIKSGMISRIRYDGTDWILLNPLPTTARQIQPITASVAGNALTVTLNPTTLEFRSSTLSSGTVNQRTVGSAISLTVPSGATLGTASGQAARLAILAIDNAGTVEPAIVNIAGGEQLDETGVISTTALDAASDSAGVIYSTTARTNVPYRLVGLLDITEATAGTWATAPSTIQGAGGQAGVSVAMNAHGAAPMFACRAWCSFNGTGTVAILASGNVSSITDNGTGDYTVNFATAMPDANYAATGSVAKNDSTNDGNARIQVGGYVGALQTASAVRVRTHQATSSTAVDSPLVTVAVFR